MKLAIYIRNGRADGRLIAYSPDLPGCSATGTTEEQVIKRIRRRIKSHFASENQTATASGLRRVEIEV